MSDSLRIRVSRIGKNSIIVQFRIPELQNFRTSTLRLCRLVTGSLGHTHTSLVRDGQPYIFQDFRTSAFPNSCTSILCVLVPWWLIFCVAGNARSRLQPSCCRDFHGIFGPEMFRITSLEIFFHKLIRTRPEPRKIGSRLDRPH